MALHDFLADGQPHPGTRILLLAVKALEDDEDTLGKPGIQADVVIPARKQPLVCI
jgi:hypothetical protein